MLQKPKDLTIRMLRPLRPLANRLPARHDLVRTIMHVPIGIICGLAVLVDPMLAGMIFVAFLAYEILEDWRIGDHSYMDLNGLVFGLIIATVMIALGQGAVWFLGGPG